MAIKLQSNYIYSGNDFLDGRQSMANSLDDLKNWFIKENPEEIIVIPDGFEIRVEGNWYVYDPKKEPNDITGYFSPRLTEESVKNLLPDGLIKVGEVIGTVDLI